MKSFISVVIPARNEEATVENVVRSVGKHPAVACVIVVDNGSIDNTASLASLAGARVVSEPMPGLGRAMKKGINVAPTDYILRTDADITNWNSTWIDHLCEPKRDHLTRAVFTSPYDEFPVTRLVVQPYIETFVPELASLPRPISGTYSFKKISIEWRFLPDDWAWDIALVIQAHERGLMITDVRIGELIDKQRDIRYYEPMARDIHRYFLNKFTQTKKRFRP